MENINIDKLSLNQELPKNDSEPTKIKKKSGPKPMVFRCECGYEARRIFDIQRHKAREIPCMNGEKMDMYTSEIKDETIRTFTGME